MYWSPGEILHRNIRNSVVILMLLCMCSCAKQGFPPGGPVDETPPALNGTVPDSKAINVPVDITLEFHFSESMDEERVEDNFFMVPIPSVWPSFEWHDRSRICRVQLNEELEPDATYVVSIGAKASDRNRNGLAESVMLTFSTGDVLEDRRIRGNVIPAEFLSDEPERVSQVDVVAFRLEGDSNPDPRDDIPDYVTQSGTDGSYELMGLSGGRYRLFAIGDKDGDGYYTENYDQIGIAPLDISLAGDDSVAVAPDIMVAMRYRSDVQLTSARAPDSRRMELYFDRAVDPDRLIFDIPGLDVFGWYRDSENPRMISAATGLQQNERYEVTGLDAFDADGNRLMKLDVIPFFDGSDRPDTTALAIIDQIPDVVSAPNEAIYLTFNRMLDMPGGVSGIVTDDNRLSLAIDQIAPNRLLLRPVTDWEYGMTYSIAFDNEMLKGIGGNTMTNDGAGISVRTIPADSLTSMDGTLNDAHSSDGPYRVLAKDIVSGYMRELTLDGPGTWSTGSIQPGTYVLYAHHDANGDGAVELGTIEPFDFSERVIAFPDTINLEPRWPKSDIILSFEK